MSLDLSLSYGTHLWGSIKVVEDQSDESRAFLKRLASFVKDKADLDHHYSKSLRKLVEKLHIEDAPSDGKTLEMFLSSFKEVLSAISASFDSAATKADESVLRPLQTYTEAHKKQGKALEDEIAKAQKLHRQHLDELQAAQLACRKACDELLKAKENPNQILSPTGAAATIASPSSSSSSSPPSTTPPATTPVSSFDPPDALDALSGADVTPKKRGFTLFKGHCTSNAHSQYTRRHVPASYSC